MSLINKKNKVFRPLAPGKYQVIFNSWKEVAPAPGSENKEGYVQFYGVLQHNQQPITDTRFERNLMIFLGHVQQQLDLEDGMSTEDLANTICNQTTPIDIWVSHNISNDKLYTNYNYLPPLGEESSTTTTKAVAKPRKKPIAEQKELPFV